MKAVVYDRYGGPKVLQLVDDLPKPCIRANQIFRCGILVRLYQGWVYRRSPPLCLHFDCVGVLDKDDMADRLNPGEHFVRVGGKKVAKETRENLDQLMTWAVDSRY